MDGYEIEQIREGFWAIDDAKGCSFYLVEGEEKALLIDTGMQEGKILPMLKTLTNKPIELILTHAHIDHIYHADEFEQVYLAKADLKAWRGSIGLCMLLGPRLFHVAHKKYRRKEYTAIDETTIIDLGNCCIRVLASPGHTPGSITLVDETHKALFTGDAVGSGSGAWLFLPGCYNVGKYKQALGVYKEKLKAYDGYTYYGGHRKQGIPSPDKANTYRLDIQVVEDMYTLCDKMLKKEVQPDYEKKIGPVTLAGYQFGHAAMVQRKGKIK